MHSTQRRRQWGRRLAPLALVMLIVGIVPNWPNASQAQSGIIDQALDDTQSDFVRGNFLGAAVSPDHRRDVLSTDADGAVQLTPIGILNPWPLGGLLPRGLADHGVAVVRDRLFTVAGAISDGSTDAVYGVRIDQSTGNFIPHGNEVNPDGRYVTPNWTNDPLPPAQGSFYEACTGTNLLTVRTNTAVASLDKGDGTGYIYAIGGIARLPSCGLLGTPTRLAEAMTVPTVQRGEVGATGIITWTGGNTLINAYLPSPLVINDTPTSIYADHKLGIYKSQALVARAPNGKYFLYVMGGEIRYPNFNFEPDRTDRRSIATPAVFYTEIDPATGNFKHPLNSSTTAPWARTTNIPVLPPAGGDPAQTFGLYDHVATVARAVSGTGVNAVFRDAIFIVGGYVDSNVAPNPLLNSNRNPYVYLATIANDGSLSWDRTPTRVGTTQDNLDPPGTLVATEGNPVAALAGMAFNNKLYLIGGTTGPDNTNALDSVITGVYDGDFQFQPLLTDSEFFVGRDQITPVLPAKIAGPASATMQASAPANDPNAAAAWAFVVGGQNEVGELSDAIYTGRVGGVGETSTNAVRSRDAWYYSRYIDTSLERAGQDNSAARVLKIRWATEIDRSSNANADIQLDFRYVRRSDLRCDAGAFDDILNPWFALDGDLNTSFRSHNLTTTNPLNEVELEELFDGQEFNATCIQYRARITQNGVTDGTPNVPSNPAVTPRLLNISLEKTLPGYPDLRVLVESDFQVIVENGAFADIDLGLINLNGDNPDDVTQTLAANHFGEDGEIQVALCWSYDPDQAPPDPEFPTLPWTGTDRIPCAPVYTSINRLDLSPGASVTLSRFSEWLQNDPNNSGIPLDEPFGDLGELFLEPGYYKLAVIIDPTDLLNEGTNGELNNRLEQLNNGTPLIRSFQIGADPVINPTPRPTRTRLPAAPTLTPTLDPSNPTQTNTPVGGPSVTPTVGIGTPTVTPEPTDRRLFLPVIAR